jgi:hypothetical protein
MNWQLLEEELSLGRRSNSLILRSGGDGGADDMNEEDMDIESMVSRSKMHQQKMAEAS